MTTTYGNLVDEVALNLAGYSLRQDRLTHLTSAITSSDLSLNLGSSTNIGKGLIEIGDELLWIDSFDKIASTATVAPYGRGFNGTTAASHAINSKVTVAPTFPRVAIRKAINEAIQSVYPKLFALGTYELTFNTARNTYEIPSEVQTIQYVSWQTIGPSREWRPVKGWRQDPYASHDSFATNNSITIYDAIPAGRKVFVHYTTVPTTFNGSGDSSDFATTTGLLDSAKDVVIYGACYRLASFIDAGRLNYLSAEADNTDTKIQYGSGASNSRYYLALYDKRLKEEMDKLRDLFPSRTHYTRY